MQALGGSQWSPDAGLGMPPSAPSKLGTHSDTRITDSTPGREL